MTIKNEFSNFINKLKSYPIWQVVVVVVASFITHGSILFSKTIGIDEEAAILGIEPYADQGRQGILWIRDLLQISKFNIYLITALTFFLLILSALVFYAGFATKESDNKNSFIPFCLFFITSPYWACQLYFFSQSVPVLFSLILVPFIYIFVENAIKAKIGGKILLFVIGSVLFQLVVSTYQINVIIYVAYVCAIFTVERMHGKESVKKNLIVLLIHAAFVVVGVVLYRIITEVFYSLSSYLTDQIMWQREGLVQGIKNILKVVISSVKGSGSRGLYNFTYVPICIVTFIFSVINCVVRHEGKKCILTFVTELGLFASPYFFPVLYGGEVSPRMRYIFPVVGAFVIFICFREFKLLFAGAKKAKLVVKWVLACGFIVCFFADIMSNLNNTNFLYYTNDYRYEKEYLIARDLQRDLDQYFVNNSLDESERDFVIFLGDVNIDYNDMCLPGWATIGSSNINWDSYMMVRGRIYKFLQVIGYPIGKSPYFSEGASIAYEYYFEDYFGKEVNEMPEYPLNGYIKRVENDELGLHYIVVKLGNDWKVKKQ